MWKLKNDDSRPIFTAEKQVKSAHRGHSGTPLPEKTAIVFFMGRGLDLMRDMHPVTEVDEGFPCFLNRRALWTLNDLPACYLYGGAGAPMAADTVETLAALGVKNIVSVGLCGGFSDKVHAGEIIVPEKAFVEEGTSLHYYDGIVSASPDEEYLKAVSGALEKRTHPIVSMDAPYRQTFKKEAEWRRLGAVGVEMETSAVFSVSKYLGLRAISLLMVSDIHPIEEGAPEWSWRMTNELRRDLVQAGFEAARLITEIGKRRDSLK